MITVGDEKTSFHTWHHDVLAGNSSAKSEHWHIGVILTWATLDKWYQLSTKLYYDNYKMCKLTPYIVVAYE